MSGGHGHAGSLHEPLFTLVHRADAAVKLASLVGFLLAVVATPARAVWAFVVYAALVVALAALARIPASVLLRRMLVEVPFIGFAIALPFVGQGPHHEFVGTSISIPGAWAAWSIVAKATIGTAATVVLAWSSPITDLLAGLERLRVPRVLVAIAGFMVRYLDIVMGDLRRLQISRVSRGDDPRWAWQGRAVAATAGTLFVRSFERGERVQQAMTARGFTGRFPDTATVAEPLRWFPALIWPLTAWSVAAAAVFMR